MPENASSIRVPSEERIGEPSVPLVKNHPSARYAAPGDVLRDSALSEVEKRNVLQRWALEAYLSEVGPLKQQHDIAHPTQLDEVIDALIDLDEMESRRAAARTPGLDCNAAR